eukprot:TRINITY_DN6691_c0_g1_i1.p1 TRINITY_DN6691_c0_g1~~TRINITY_DN6691_c0_g1_i1.p1  ORF type:complete len:231 (-),score=27.84 TRINITY_DN6691_c0_g1_i1:3282-3974(-)
MRFLIIGLIVIISLPVKSQDFLSYQEYEKLWKHVKTMPESQKKTPELIVDYLKKATTDERKLIEILYYWMSANIEYDIEGYLNNNIDYSALNVLKSRKAVCQGYSDLFKILCDKANIECVVITGYAKGYGYNGTRFKETNHAWNAVKLKGEWKLIDTTWGSGGAEMINDSLVYEPNLNLGYLFSRPEEFIIQHFPEDSYWQLLDEPITIDEFYSKEMDAKLNEMYNYLRD